MLIAFAYFGELASQLVGQIVKSFQSARISIPCAWVGQITALYRDLRAEKMAYELKASAIIEGGRL